MLNYYFKDKISSFLLKSTKEIIGEITLSNQFDSKRTQNKSWETQIPILKETLQAFDGSIFFEFSIPRLGKRVDVIVIIKNVVFVIEFKVGENKYLHDQIDQVWDYALDLKNFHQPSHNSVLAPILLATEAKQAFIDIITSSHDDKVIYPIRTNKISFKRSIDLILEFFDDGSHINADSYSAGKYSPTPTIVEAAVSLYNNHSVDEITRNDAQVKNLTNTTSEISSIIEQAKLNQQKAICFVTGVPGAGKTLVGLKIATTQLEKKEGSESVYLSGNGPLVSILQEALARDKVENEKLKGNKISKSEAKAGVKTFIQIIHHYRDAYLVDKTAPYDHVAIFDEAQRAWNKEQTVKFMKQKKGQPDFDYSEPEFLISCLDRHKDWAVIVCLVGGGQEINTGEAGISEWLEAIKNRFTDWKVYISPNLKDAEYDAEKIIVELQKKGKVHRSHNLHLAVSMRSYRAENLSNFVQQLLDQNIEEATKTFNNISENYPIVLTRDLSIAKKWLKEKSRGNERYGLTVSSQAYRLKPFAIDVKYKINPVHWFLNSKNDVRSSYYLEAVATEFDIQGLELDWACVMWDGDLRYANGDWKTFSFRGSKWMHIRKEERKRYLINAYRVLLTRARQGMVIVVPEGNPEDYTRKSEYYDPTFNYLKRLGLKVI